MDTKKIEEVINRAKHELTRELVSSNLGNDLTIDDLELILNVVDKNMRRLVVDVKYNLPSSSSLDSIECRGSTIIGYHYFGGVKTHILQVKNEDNTISYFTNSKREKILDNG
jgi:hypothetical protein